MRIGAQDVQVISPHDPDIEELEAALTAAELAYELALEEKVTEADEKQLQAEIDAVKAVWNAKHGLAEVAAKVIEASKAVDDAYAAFDDEEEEGVA